MTYRIPINKQDPDWVKYVANLEHGINCACCNGFIYRFYRADAFQMVYGTSPDISTFGREAFSGEVFREFLNTLFVRRYFFSKCDFDPGFGVYVLTGIVNVRKLLDSELAEALLI